jgi:hypothetical protein
VPRPTWRGFGARSQVDEHTLSVTKRRHADERPHGFDVAARLADEPADIAVRQLHLDRYGSAATLGGLDDDLVRLVGQ